jgi:DNA-binding PadR family transcriptional regulator
MSITSAEAALLGLLTEGPKHPYQIEKDVQFRDMRFWTELSMSAIYKLLRKLEEEEFVTCETEITEENRARKIYSITEQGETALREKLAEILLEPEHIRWQADIAFYNLDVFDRKMRLAMLKDYRRALVKKIAEYRDLETFLLDSDCSIYPISISRRPIYLLEGEIRWLDDFVKDIEADKSKI